MEESIRNSICLLFRRFAQETPLAAIDFQAISKLDWDGQALLFDELFSHPLLVKYPVQRKYRIAFLKRLISEWETNCDEIFDQYYELLCTLVQEEKVDDHNLTAVTYWFKHFTLKYPERIVTIKEHAANISHGTTGLKVWQASIELSEFMLANQHLFMDKYVLELGAGVGLLGLVAAKEIGLKQIYMSDCHPEVLNILKENVKINFDSQDCEPLPDDVDEPTVRLKIKTDKIELGVLQLPWEECEERQVFEKCGTPDVLLAADVVYDSSIFVPLLKVIDLSFTKNENLLFILCCTLRDPETLASFLKLLEQSNYSAELQPSVSNEDRHFWNKDENIRIYFVRRL